MAGIAYWPQGGHRMEPGLTSSLCEQCGWMREIKTPKGSRFVLCGLARRDERYPKYPPQPIVRCAGFRANAAGAGP